MNHTTRPPSQREVPERLNLLLFGVLCASVILLYLGIPWLLQRSLWWGLLCCLIVACTNTHWSLLHEAIHGVLHSKRSVNDSCGRVLSILLGAPFEALRIGHLQHHRRNATIFDRPEVFDPAVTASRSYALRYYFQLLLGLYVSELLSLFFVLLPRKTGVWALHRFAPGDDDEAVSYRNYVEARLYQPDVLQRARQDALGSLLLFSLAFFLYGGYWPILALCFLMRGFLLSFADNSYHYGDRLGDVFAAYNARVPRWWSLMLLHFHLHAVHHRHPGVSWVHLPALFLEENDHYHQSHIRLLLQQLNGPISANDLPKHSTNEG